MSIEKFIGKISCSNSSDLRRRWPLGAVSIDAVRKLTVSHMLSLNAQPASPWLACFVDWCMPNFGSSQKRYENVR